MAFPLIAVVPLILGGAGVGAFLGAQADDAIETVTGEKSSALPVILSGVVLVAGLYFIYKIIGPRGGS